MQNSFEQYRDYSVSDFMLDDDFINWVQTPGEEDMKFWSEFILANPQQAKNIEDAKALMVSIDTSVAVNSDELKDAIWKNINSTAVYTPVVKMRSRSMWMAAASVIVILIAAGGYFYFNKAGKKEIVAVEKNNSPLKTDVAPGNNKAFLTLSDGSTINLDSAQNGNLTQQGNSKIIKLKDGQVAYQSAHDAEPATVQYNTVATPRGGQFQLVLSDGSKVWLNAASSIRFPATFTGNDRNVEITGEVYFEVAHNANMPFNVKANDVNIKVLGTHFNVDAYNDENSVKTTLLQGSVKVSKGNANKLIVPGEQAVVDKSLFEANAILIKKDVDVEEVVAWKNGLFSFQNAGIKKIMQELSRWYDVDVVYEGAIPDITFSGEIGRNLSLTQVLSALSEMNIHYKIEKNKLIITN